MSLLNNAGGNTSSDSILWKTESAVHIDSGWILDKAEMDEYKNITMDAGGSAISISMPIENLKVDYAKFKIALDSDDDTLTTNGVANVVGLAKFYYANPDDDTLLDVATESFYPKYVFEDDFIQNFTVIKTQGSRELKRVDIIISNSEQSPIIIRDITLTFNQDKGGEVSASEFKSLSSKVNTNTQNIQRLVIPLWTDEFLIEHGMGDTLKDGEIGRMESLSEFSYIYDLNDEEVLLNITQYQKHIEDLEYQIWKAQIDGEDSAELTEELLEWKRNYENYLASLLVNQDPTE